MTRKAAKYWLWCVFVCVEAAVSRQPGATREYVMCFFRGVSTAVQTGTVARVVSGACARTLGVCYRAIHIQLSVCFVWQLANMFMYLYVLRPGM